MRFFLILFFSYIISDFAFAQSIFTCTIKDSTTKESLPGVVVILEGTNNASSSNINGFLILHHIPAGENQIKISLTGYSQKKVVVNFNGSDSIHKIIFLQSASKELDEIVVSSTRTNARIEDLPIKVEVLGQEEMDEESTIVPGGIGSILGDLSIITIQKTNPVNGNDAVRMQGLEYKYTQLLRDGLPLYEGFSGSLGVLSIPPLDLKQVEIIKGSASTLYGGGAIGGLINFISKTPGDSASAVIVLNQTSLKETNLNSFFSKRNNKIGITLFSGANIKQAIDINKDGFAEIPQQNNFIFHPRAFFYFSNKINADLGLTVSSDNRKGGDIHAIKYKEDTIHTFLFTEKVIRSTADAHLNYQVNSRNSFNLKSTLSGFNRSLYYNKFNFSGEQISSYSEINHLFKNDKHTLVTGVNFNTEQFQKLNSDTVNFNNYYYQTIGFFSQENWQVVNKLSIEAGIRVDDHNIYNFFILPRFGFFYKPNEKLSVRLHYGSGYKIPNLFSTSQPNEYPYLLPIKNNVKAELSNGVNMDINYHTFVFGKLSIQLNQAFYYTDITNATILVADSMGKLSLENAKYNINSLGTDTYLRFALEDLELYLGYNHTEAKLIGTSIDFNMPFNPKDKFATTIAYEIEGNWRMGVEAAYNANQYIYNNIKVPNYWFFAGMIERKFKAISIVLNCENIGDYRQSKYESLVLGNTQNPTFKSIWGPIEGRVYNLSIKFRL